MTEQQIEHLLGVMALVYIGLVAIAAPIALWWWVRIAPETGDGYEKEND